MHNSFDDITQKIPKETELGFFEAKCACCMSVVKVPILSQEIQAKGVPVHQCKCRQAPKCFSCGRCEEHHRCGNGFWSNEF